MTPGSPACGHPTVSMTEVSKGLWETSTGWFLPGSVLRRGAGKARVAGQASDVGLLVDPQEGEGADGGACVSGEILPPVVTRLRGPERSRPAHIGSQQGNLPVNAPLAVGPGGSATGPFFVAGTTVRHAEYPDQLEAIYNDIHVANHGCLCRVAGWHICHDGRV